MARDSHIVRPKRAGRLAAKPLTQDQKIRIMAQHVLREVAQRIDALPHKPRRS